MRRKLELTNQAGPLALCNFWVGYASRLRCLQEWRLFFRFGREYEKLWGHWGRRGLRLVRAVLRGQSDLRGGCGRCLKVPWANRWPRGASAPACAELGGLCEARDSRVVT